MAANHRSVAPTLSGRFSRQMKCDKRPHRTVTRRGVNDPIGQSQGGTYRPIPGSFTPRLHLSNLMRAPCGRHRTPSERVGAAGASSRIATCCLRHAGPRVPTNLLRTDLLLLVTNGDNLKVVTRPPFCPLPQTNQGARNRESRVGSRGFGGLLLRPRGRWKGRAISGREPRSGDANNVRQV
jgi:hypothetical protein